MLTIDDYDHYTTDDVDLTEYFEIAYAIFETRKSTYMKSDNQLKLADNIILLFLEAVKI